MPGTSHRPGAASKAWPAAGVLGSPRPATQTAGCRTDGKAFDPVAALVLSIPPGTEPCSKNFSSRAHRSSLSDSGSETGAARRGKLRARRGHRRPDYVPDVRERDLPADARGAALCCGPGCCLFETRPPWIYPGRASWGRPLSRMRQVRCWASSAERAGPDNLLRLGFVGLCARFGTEEGGGSIRDLQEVQKLACRGGPYAGLGTPPR